MTVSYQLLFAAAEPDVITSEMTRECIELPSADPDHNSEKRRTMPFRDITCLAYSFRNLSHIDNLHGLQNLVQLKLDNNRITDITNLSHLTNLTWLDLSFNSISRIEGLDTLSKLEDLSLFSNQISELEGLDALVNLQVLSLGNNLLNKLDRVMYLRQFKNLQLVNLAGNPLCREVNYKSYLLSHIRNITYLDYRRVNAEEVQAAMEQHQDEMLDLLEKEEVQEQEEQQAAKLDVHRALMQAANLEGVDTFFDDLTKNDPDWAKLAEVPGLTDGWTEVKDKFQTTVDEFKSNVLQQHGAKKREYEEWLDAVKETCDSKDAEARDIITQFEKLKKRLVCKVQANAPERYELIQSAEVKLSSMKTTLIAKEMEMVEELEELLEAFDRNYSEMAEANKQQIMAFFHSLRELETNFSSHLGTTAMTLYEEKYNVESSDALDALSDKAKVLMSDKDILMNTIQATHDLHNGRMDALEDTLTTNEIKHANEVVSQHTKWAFKRNRDRIGEIITYVNLQSKEIQGLIGYEDQDE